MEDWREELLSALFPEETRSYDKGVFEYDASDGNKFMFAFRVTITDNLFFCLTMNGFSVCAIVWFF